jgi:hypothetical protein
LVAALSNDWHVGIWDLTTHRLLHILEVTPGSHSDNSALSFSPDGRQLAFSAGHEASLWGVVTGEPLKRWPLPEGLVDYVAFSKDNRLLLFRDEQTTAIVGRAAHNRPAGRSWIYRIRNLTGAEPLTPIAEIQDFLKTENGRCSPDGAYLVLEGWVGSIGRRSRSANLYSGQSGAKIAPLRPANGKPWTRAAFSFDPGGTILSCEFHTDEWQTSLLELPSRRLVRQLDVCEYRLGPEAKRWVRAFEHFWDAAAAFTLFERERDGPLVSFVLDSDQVNGAFSAQFSRTGTHLVWGNSNGTVTVVDLVEVQRRLAAIGLGW